MKIIIVGIGKVGITLAENLANDDHEVTLIDVDETKLKKAEDTLDVLCIKGNGASIGILKQAGIDDCDVLIAVTGRDELNMVCCLTAKKLGAKYTVARIRDYDYAMELSQLKHEMDIDVVINPEHATAMQITRLIRFPEAMDIETFYRGRLELIGFKAIEDDPILDTPLMNLSKRFSNFNVLFCAVKRGDETIIPNGSTTFQVGDKIYVIGESLDISRFFNTLGRGTRKIRNVFIIGGGRITYYVSQALLAMNIDVKIIERVLEICVKLAEALPKALIIHGDGTDQDLLDAENLPNAGAFLALTGDDEDNIITSLYAKQFGVPKVVTKVSRQNYYSIINQLNIDSIVSPKLTTAYTILHKIRAMVNSQGSRMEALYPIADGRAEAMEFIASHSTRHQNKPLKELRLKKGILLASIIRRGQIIIPSGSDCIVEGDSVIVISNGKVLMDLNDIFIN
ncbi:MAG: Trk system potassium transporter TrkA [Oscillospiraceae bacterium]|nr:Trk system potassium transporter TrkA [Oscillospiraceae bacterium]